MRQAAPGSLGLGELRTESTAKSVTGSDLCPGVSAQIPAVRYVSGMPAKEYPCRAEADDLRGPMRGWRGSPEPGFAGEGDGWVRGGIGNFAGGGIAGAVAERLRG